MATVLDISILNSFTIVVVFLLVFVGGWGVLMYADPFKEKGKNFYGLIAFFIAVLTVVSKGVMDIILFSTPWLVFLVLIGFFFIFFAKMFFVSESSLRDAMTGPVKGWLIFFVAIIMLFGFAFTYGQSLLSSTVPTQETTVSSTDTGSGSFGGNLLSTLFHPKILGVLFMFMLGTLAILMLGKP